MSRTHPSRAHLVHCGPPGARRPVPGEGAAMPPRTGSVAAALVTALVVTALAAPPAHAATVTIAVAPTGDDANPGTPEQPVATPAKAQQLARAQSGANDVVVQLAGGTYRLSA